MKKTKYVTDLSKVYEDIEDYTKEVVFFVEQVTGHLIPDFRYALKNGIDKMISEIDQKEGKGYTSMRIALGYGVDPLFGEATNGLGFRMLSNMKLPFDKMNGGYASHLGIDPKYFKGETYEEKGLEFETKIIRPLFFNTLNDKIAPFYLYVNVTTPETLRKVLANPEIYAPSGVYIMRIHGTFVNFLDLSSAIQEDIIKRLDLKSTQLEG